MNRPKIGIISLGCPRNLVDTELVLGRLTAEGCSIADGIDGSDIAIINTCAFVKDAKREAIDIILQAAELKKRGRTKGLIVIGCLSQRYSKDLKKDIPEIDAILGIDSFKEIGRAVASIMKERPYLSVKRPGVLHSHKDPRSVITPQHYVYLKIAEGCRNHCSYCAIYNIRGGLRSRPIISLIKEARGLLDKGGVSELNIIAQDTTSYGADRYKGPRLCELLKRICALKKAHWIRLLYAHPRHFTGELLDVIAKEEAMCKYIDLPIQHISDRILKRMNRGVTRSGIEKLIGRIRKSGPSIALRTSVITGFPGETEEEFRELLDFIREVKFERLGAFIFSREENTPAYNFKGQISDETKERRFNEIMRTQKDISVQINRAFIGREIEVLIDEKDDKDPKRYIGRTQYDAPEVDGQVYVYSKRPLMPGVFKKVNITDTLEYDLTGDAR